MFETFFLMLTVYNNDKLFNSGNIVEEKILEQAWWHRLKLPPLTPASHIEVPGLAPAALLLIHIPAIAPGNAIAGPDTQAHVIQEGDLDRNSET